jgi:hypothetical protein
MIIFSIYRGNKKDANKMIKLIFLFMGIFIMGHSRSPAMPEI